MQIENSGTTNNRIIAPISIHWRCTGIGISLPGGDPPPLPNFFQRGGFQPLWSGGERVFGKERCSFWCPLSSRLKFCQTGWDFSDGSQLAAGDFFLRGEVFLAVLKKRKTITFCCGREWGSENFRLLEIRTRDWNGGERWIPPSEMIFCTLANTRHPPTEFKL